MGDPSPAQARRVTIGVLALQGAFQEHLTALGRLASSHSFLSSEISLHAITVRSPPELALCDALIIPGGESTTIALLLATPYTYPSPPSSSPRPPTSLLAELRTFIHTHRRPVWGTCAGAILLSKTLLSSSSKKGGQELLGGIDVRIQRNGWGRQGESFEVGLEVKAFDAPFTAVFIRAPVVLELLPGNEPIEVVARLPEHIVPRFAAPEPGHTNAGTREDARLAVALRQGPHFMTTFHPELSGDDRFHAWFIRECVLGRS